MLHHGCSPCFDNTCSTKGVTSGTRAGSHRLGQRAFAFAGWECRRIDRLDRGEANRFSSLRLRQSSDFGGDGHPAGPPLGPCTQSGWRGRDRVPRLPQTGPLEIQSEGAKAFGRGCTPPRRSSVRRAGHGRPWCGRGKVQLSRAFVAPGAESDLTVPGGTGPAPLHIQAVVSRDVPGAVGIGGGQVPRGQPAAQSSGGSHWSSPLCWASVQRAVTRDRVRLPHRAHVFPRLRTPSPSGAYRPFAGPVGRKPFQSDRCRLWTHR